MNHTFTLDFLSKYRSQLMGFAIFWIFFYHTGVNIPGLNALFSIGWIGVEIFFLVSGFGLCASLAKNPDILQFYKRRLIRILPTWWLILAIMHVLGLYMGMRCPHTVWESVQWYTGLGWWNGGLSFEWYMPTLIAFYLIAPLVNKLSNKGLIAGILIFVLTGILLHEFKILEHVYMSYQRIPVFLMGFLMYRKYKEGGIKNNYASIITSIVIGLAIFGYAYKFKDVDIILSLEMRRYALLLFLVPMLYAITSLIAPPARSTKLKAISKYVQSFFACLGVISMEIYLLHINHDYSVVVTDYLETYMNGYLVNFLWFTIVVVVAYIIHTSVKFVQSKI